MKITYICNEYPPAPHGGIGTFVQTLARGLVAKGHPVSVVGWGHVAGEREDHGVRVVTLPACRRRGVGWFVNRRRLHRWLREEVRAGRTEIIETPEYDGPLPFALDGCPVVVRLHLAATTICRQTGRRLSLPQWWSENRTLRRHPNWVAVSRHALRLTQDTFRAAPKRQAVIYYPVSSSARVEGGDPALPKEFVLYAGTVSRRKGAFVLAEAARELLAAHRDLHVVYAGGIETERSSPADARIRSIVRNELSARVHFLGRVERAQILACMRRARVFAFPSGLETFGLVTAEAMLEGCPVVVCDAGPIPEFVEHERTGLLIPPNDPKALAASVSRLLSDPALAERLGRAGKESIASRCSVETAVEHNLEFYRACLADAAGSADLRFAVSPTCSRQTVVHCSRAEAVRVSQAGGAAIRQTGGLRYEKELQP
jgi:glycosyltransferase involved in cell wall biosynthesis